MQSSALRALEFDRIVDVVAGLAVTPTGHARLTELQPLTESSAVGAAQRATTEGVRFLADHPGFPLRAPSDLEEIIDALADYLESIEQSRAAVTRLDAPFPILRGLVESVAAFKGEIADVRRKIDPSGEVADHATPALANIRDRLRKQRAKLRTTLESFLRGRDTAKYLQDQVITDRNGRYVLVVRAEHRGAIPGVVHGASASGASLFLEPLSTVDINNDIVALEEQEAEEVRRILLALTDQFRGRPADLSRTIDVATGLDVIQARARLSQMVQGVEPQIAVDGTVDLKGARHPLLIARVRDRLDESEDEPESAEERRSGPDNPVPVDIHLIPPVRVLVIAGPNTGGKTVALKTAGLLAAMAQAGLHIPADAGSRLPVFRSIFADIGDEQSISASLSTFSAHIAHLVAIERRLELPALVLLDEIGAGTDPNEGAALGMAVIDHFRKRGAHLVATTHYESLKTYATTTEGAVSAAFGFDPETFAPSYRLVYGSAGRSLAIEIAARLGMPGSVIAAARENRTEREKQLADHLARIDKDLSALEQERRQLGRERMTVAETDRKLRAREDALREREERLRHRLDAKVDDHVREARREIDAVVERLKARAAELSQQAGVRLKSGEKVRAAGLTTGDVGTVRAEARSALDRILEKVNKGGESPGAAAVAAPAAEPERPIEAGMRVTVGALGLEGVVVNVQGKHAEVDVRGKRLRAALRDLRAIAGAPPPPKVKVSVDLQPREGALSEINLIGSTVDDAIARLEKFLDESTLSDIRELRIVHGHGTGQLRRAVAGFLKEHPLVERFESAPQNQGGGGATIVTLKD